MPFTLENPANSHFWAAFASFARADARSPWHAHAHTTFQVTFDHCMYGGSRPKSTRLLTNCPTMADLTARCDRSHDHEPWGASFGSSGWVFATHKEASYPVGLAEALAEHFKTHALSRQAVFPPRPIEEQHAALAVQGLQSRKSAALLSEFAYVTSVPRSQVDPARMRELTAPMIGVRTGGPLSAPVASADLQLPLSSGLPSASAAEFDPKSSPNAPRPGVGRSSGSVLQPPAGLDQQASTSLAQSAECLPAACANEFDPMSLHNAPRPGVDKSSCVLQSLAGIDQQATPSDLAQPFVEGSGKVRVGVYRTPEAWVTEALQLPHPMDSYNPLQEAT